MSLDQQTLKSILHYDPLTGDFTYLVRSGRGGVGTRAGAIKRLGYVSIQVKGRQYQAHRLAWLYVHGDWPKGCIDHIDRDPSNNRIENLRDATAKLNANNRKKPNGGSNPLMGATLHKSGKWQAAFQGRYLGLFDSPDAANAAYMNAKQAGGYQ